MMTTMKVIQIVMKMTMKLMNKIKQKEKMGWQETMSMMQEILQSNKWMNWLTEIQDLDKIREDQANNNNIFKVSVEGNSSIDKLSQTVKTFKTFK